jgi:hypothetical protein
VVGSSAALLIGGLMGTAHADPAPLPAPNIGDQLVTTVASAPQLLQSLAGAFGGQPATPPPLASASIKMPQSAGTGLPGTGSTLPGASSLIPGAAPATTSGPTLGLPGFAQPAPAAAAPTLGLPGFTQPAAAATTPGLGIPGLTQPAVAAPATGLGIPGLTQPAAAAPVAGPAGMLPQAQLNLPQMPFLPLPLPSQVSLPGDLTSLFSGAAPAAAPSLPVSAAAPVASPNPLLFPVSALP